MYENSFIEISRKVDRKMLNTIGIRQIADSLKTHGLGVINSNINAVYKFISKFYRKRFSNFLIVFLIGNSAFFLNLCMTK